MRDNHTLYRHFCHGCQHEYLSEFRTNSAAYRYDHRDECDHLALLRAEFSSPPTPDQARVDASNDAAQEAIEEFYATIRG